MIKTAALSLAILAAGTLPTLAATHYYVAHEANSMKCSVVSKRPDGKMMIAVGGAHKTKALADTAMTSAPACKM
ncbi:hypothetical protein ASE04_09805 [Rhizobium sp. Root708]|uniref:hypothetical protein n=1 Tax=Rhizobium sp. Root708 TaxID=1736592 RepID=UPI0006FD2461|nr:hypothetical protein [Rhizobium sp. Root708]KRB51815.1 hypothetical protein ASE04_09805 [Rhizobium sp. Root708]